MSTYNRLDLQTRGSQPIMPKNLPDHCLVGLLSQKKKKKKRNFLCCFGISVYKFIRRGPKFVQLFMNPDPNAGNSFTDSCCLPTVELTFSESPVPEEMHGHEVGKTAIYAGLSG